MSHQLKPKRKTHMTPDFQWEKLDIKPLGRALAQRKIPRWAYNKIVTLKPVIISVMEKIESASEISPFPPTILIPEAIYDFDFNIVVHACPSVYKRANTVYFTIELSAPSILLMPSLWFLGLLAHEFLHYVIHTINLHKKLVELESKGDSKSKAIVGVIPNREKMTIEERDRYFYGDPEVWLKDNKIIQAVKEIGFLRDTNSGREIADKVMKWINERRGPMKEFKRGEVTGYKGVVWLHQSIIEKAKSLGLI